MDAQQAWQAALDQLERDIPRSNFNKWVRDTTVLSYQDGRFRIAVPTVIARDWLEDRLTSTVRRFLMGALVRNDIVVHFVVKANRTDEDAETLEEAAFGNSEAGQETLNIEPTLELQNLHGWIPLSDELVKEYGLCVASVAGKILSCSLENDRACWATVAELARDLQLTERTVTNAISILIAHGYVKKVFINFYLQPCIYKVTERMRSLESSVIIQRTLQWDSTINFSPW